MSGSAASVLERASARGSVRVAVWVAPLVLYLVALAVRLAVTAWVPFPPTEGSLYYLDVARNLVSGDGLVTNVQWSYATPPIGVPRPAFDLWLPLASFVDALPMLVLGHDPPGRPAGHGRCWERPSRPSRGPSHAKPAGSTAWVRAGRRPPRIGAGILAALLGPWLVATAGPDSTVPFAVLGTPRRAAHRPAAAAHGRRVARLGRAGLALGLALGLTYLARQEVVWIGLTLVLLAVPHIRRLDGRSGPRDAPAPRAGRGRRAHPRGALAGPPAADLRRERARGRSWTTCCCCATSRSSRSHDAPTLDGFLAQGVGGILGNIARAVAMQLTDTVRPERLPGRRRGHRRAHRPPQATIAAIGLGARGAPAVGRHHVRGHRAAVPGRDAVGHLPARLAGRSSWVSSWPRCWDSTRS